MRTPRSTYRLQFDPAQLDLAGGAELVAYLDALGVSHVFASPLLTSRPASTHGYDVVDPTRLDPELGGREGLEVLSARLADRSMGLVLDIVPNHMAIGRHDPWWMEVLELGAREAPHGAHFDIYEPDQPLILPLLGRPYAEALADGELRLVLEDGQVLAAYWDERFPLDPLTLAPVLAAVGGSERAAETAGEDRAPAERSAALASELRTLAPEARAALEASLDTMSNDPDRLHALLDAQHYRLAWWQLSRERLGHRRFFTIMDLAGVRQEIGRVFDDTHALVIELIEAGLVDGLRIDHIDGLRDPEGYLAKLAEMTGGAYVVVEKILGQGERLSPEWRVAGTTGYEYLDAAAKVFVDPGGYGEMSEHYRGFTGAPSDFETLVYDQRRFVIRERLGPETARLEAELEGLARNDRVARDALASDLIEAAVGVIASMPVYRTYARHGSLPETQRGHIERAVELARRRDPERSERVFEFLERLLVLDHGPEHTEQDREARTEFVERLQQFTGAVMAKGVEDTAFYQFNLLLSLNEVGGHPAELPSDPVAAFHDHNARVAAEWPATMTCSSTHDTKRSEDVRARISALTQAAGDWIAKVDAWHARNRGQRGPTGAPVRNEELFVYQTLVGAWPLEDREGFAERLAAHLVKAAREAKVYTAWLEPDEAHEADLVAFGTGLLADPDFVADLEAFAAPLWRAGAVDSLAQTALRLAAPGVPDIYRGTELWDLSLTDPDNRRPVDWDRRRAALEELARRSGEGPSLVARLAEHWQDGRIKMHVTRCGLELRRDRPELFAAGGYVPLAVDGDRAEHAVAFARCHRDEWVVAMVPRLTAHLAGDGLWPREGWEGTSVALPEGAPDRWWETVAGAPITGANRIEASAVFGLAPVGLLRSEGGSRA